MSLDPKKIAERLGANHVGQIPDIGGGTFGMAALTEIFKERMGGSRQGTSIRWVLSPKVPMTAETERMLIALAEKLSTPNQRVNPMELAAQLLAESIQRLANEDGR